MTCANDSKSIENVCCMNHERHCYDTTNCEDYVFETQDESFKIPKIKKLKSIPFEKVLGGMQDVSE